MNGSNHDNVINLWQLYLDYASLINAWTYFSVLVILCLAGWITFFILRRQHHSKMNVKSGDWTNTMCFVNGFSIVLSCISVICLALLLMLNNPYLLYRDFKHNVTSALQDDYRDAIHSLHKFKMDETHRDPFVWQRVYDETNSAVLKNTIEICLKSVFKDEQKWFDINAVRRQAHKDALNAGAGTDIDFFVQSKVGKYQTVFQENDMLVCLYETERKLHQSYLKQSINKMFD